MNHDLSALLMRLARHQHGLVAVWQLRNVGTTPSAIAWACRTGILLEVRRGVLAVAGTPDHPAREILAACLAAGQGAVASHWAAGAWHELKGVAPGTLELSVPARVRLAGVAVHCLPQPLDPKDRTTRHGVPVTSVPRTLIDLAGTGRMWLVERALDDALVRGLCSLSDTKRALTRAGGRRGVIGIRALIEARSLGDERVDSHQELRWLRMLRRQLGLDPVLHHKVSTPAGVFEIDLAFPTPRVGFEVNGWQAHGTLSAFHHDATKGLALLSAGWHIATLTSAMPDREVAAGVRTVLARYGNRGAS